MDHKMRLFLTSLLLALIVQSVNAQELAPNNTKPPTQTQHQHQHQIQTQHQNQSIKDSGNSSNTNDNASSANGNGDNSNNTTNNTRIPAATAFATVTPATVPCFKGYSAGGQAQQFGFSLGGGKIDDNCAKLEVARSFAANNSLLAYCMVMVTTKPAKEAGVTVDVCLKFSQPVVQSQPEPAVAVAPPEIIVPPPNITVNMPPFPVLPAPVVDTPKHVVHHNRKPCPVEK